VDFLKYKQLKLAQDQQLSILQPVVVTYSHWVHLVSGWHMQIKQLIICQFWTMIH